MIATKNKPVPVPTTVTLEMTLEEAHLLKRVLGIIGLEELDILFKNRGANYPELLKAVHEAYFALNKL